MTWIRRHNDDGRVVVVARVAAEEGNLFSVRLAVPNQDGSNDNQHLFRYASRELACDVADALVRHRHGPHACSGSCSGWTDDADVR